VRVVVVQVHILRTLLRREGVLHLGTAVVQSPEKTSAGLETRRLLQQAREAEIGEDEMAAAGAEHDVRWFDVHMHDLQRVQFQQLSPEVLRPLSANP
jgi:hypothetical protein